MTRIFAALILALAALLAGCSGGGAADQPPPIEPSVSTPADETPTPSPMSDDFATAVKFTKLTHQNKHKEANALVVPESPAARYLAFQILSAQAQRIGGYDEADDEMPSIKPDPATNSIKMRFAKTEDSAAYSYMWKDFTYEQGKITGWIGKKGPVKDVLWSRTTSDRSRGVKAKLASAYLSNGGSLWVVVELSANQARGFGDAEYAAKGGYRQTATGQNASDLSRGEKTLAYFVFDDAKFGGTLHIPYYDETGSSYGNWELKLAIK